MTGIMQSFVGASYAPVPPTTIGQAYGGGYYAGKIAVGGGGVATHYLIVAPRATGEVYGAAWGPSGGTGFSSAINGPANSAGEAALGSSYAAATFCEGLSIGGYTDWYLPAMNELEVVYYFLKPNTNGNDTGSGSNPNAVSPEPISTKYTSGSPAQTSVAIFQSGGSEAMSVAQSYWTSTDIGGANPIVYDNFAYGNQAVDVPNYGGYRTRAVRRVPV